MVRQPVISNSTAMQKTIIAITATFNKKKLVVTEYSKRTDGKFTVGLSEDIDEAYDFETRDQAKPILIRINNPHEREYIIEPLVVDVQEHNYSEEQKIA